MSDMSKPEMTAQVLVAVGAVFLLISAYVMGVYIPNQKELSDDPNCLLRIKKNEK